MKKTRDEIQISQTLLHYFVVYIQKSNASINLQAIRLINICQTEMFQNNIRMFMQSLRKHFDKNSSVK